MLHTCAGRSARIAGEPPTAGFAIHTYIVDYQDKGPRAPQHRGNRRSRGRAAIAPPGHLPNINIPNNQNLAVWFWPSGFGRLVTFPKSGSLGYCLLVKHTHPSTNAQQDDQQRRMAARSTSRSDSGIATAAPYPYLVFQSPNPRQSDVHWRWSPWALPGALSRTCRL